MAAQKEKAYEKRLWLLLLGSFLLRAVLAGWHELGNDEVYYYAYALYPDWSHFDHPPMIGWMMQLFSLNLLFDSEFFLRLSSVVLMTVNTWIIFQIGSTIKNARTGWFAALLYTTSIYAFVITGFMILPDTPQNFFYLLSLWLMMLALKSEAKRLNVLLLAIGITIGLGMISKYTSVFLWIGFGGYIVFSKRSWLKKPALYAALLLSALCLLPVLLWNIQNDFISFGFQGERVNIFDASFRPDLFFTELGGQFIYNNPVNFVLIWLAVFAAFRKKNFLAPNEKNLILWISLPLIGIFLFFSLFRSTLPHWTGPAYNTLIILAAAYLSEPRKKTLKHFFFPPSIQWAMAILLIFITVGSLQIKFGIIPDNNKQPYHQLGKNDVSLDMFGWRALLPAFEKVRNTHLLTGDMNEQDGIIGENWFPLANLDYYVARPLGLKVMGLGKPSRLHKYLWMNDLRGGLQQGDSFWYITNSRDYKHPKEVYQGKFSSIIAADTIEISRGNQPVKRYFVFLLKDLKKPQPSFFSK